MKLLKEKVIFRNTAKAMHICKHATKTSTQSAWQDALGEGEGEGSGNCAGQGQMPLLPDPSFQEPFAQPPLASLGLLPSSRPACVLVTKGPRG